jgi:cell division septal protein FtsQ
MRWPVISAAVVRHLRRATLAVLALGLLAVVAWGGPQAWSHVRSHDYFRVSLLRVRGAGPLLTEDAIRTWLRIDAHTTIWDVQPVAVRARLESHPLISRAVVRREFPNFVSISIRERRPEAIAVLDQCYYVDRHGHLLGALGAEHSRDYPMITGPTLETPPGLRTWMYRRALRVVRLCERGSCFGELSEINVAANGAIVMYPVQLRASVVLGWGSWREKLTRFDRVLRAQHGATDDIRVIDLRFRNQVVVQREPRAVPKPVAAARRGMRV